MNDWIVNEMRDFRDIPHEAMQYDKVDIVNEFGFVSEECNKVIVFCGPSVVEKWRPSASNFQTEMDL